jgi:hypothetical protein
VILLLPRGVIPGIGELVRRLRVRAAPAGVEEREAAVRDRVPGAA